MTLGKKIAVGYGLSIAMMLLVGVVSYWSAESFFSTTRWVNHTYEVLEDLSALLLSIREAETQQRGYLISESVDYLADFHSAAEDAPRMIGAVRVLTADNPEQQRRLTLIEPMVLRRLERLRHVIDLRREGGLAATTHDLAEGTAETKQIRNAIFEMKEVERSLLGKRQLEANTGTERLSAAIVVGIFLALVLVGVVGSVISRDISRDAGALLEAARRIGVGELEEKIVVRAADELGMLAEAFNQMRESLKKTMVSASTERTARERIEKLVEVTGETAGNLASAVREILASTTQQAAAAQEQAAAIGQTVTTVEEVTQTSDEAAQRARLVAETSQQALEIGRSGRKAVEDVIAVIDGVRESVESTAESVLALSEQAQAIGEIIATVNDIAEQTNILALNAAIEAARAGDASRGFSVVASEIKALADQAKKATGQVRRILGEIQKGTSTAVSATEQGTRSAGAAVRVARGLDETISRLGEMVVDGARSAAQTSASVSQQAIGMGQIRQAMHSINMAVNQNLTATRQVERTAQELTSRGEQLKELLRSY